VKVLFELSEFFVGAGFIIFYCFDEAKKSDFCEIVPASFCLLALEKLNGVRVVSLKKKTFAFQNLSQSAKFSPWELLKSLCWSKSSFLNLEKTPNNNRRPWWGTVKNCSKISAEGTGFTSVVGLF
jgi:hypothetical protein